MSRTTKLSLLALLVAAAQVMAVGASSALTINIYGGGGARKNGTAGGAISLPSTSSAPSTVAPVTALPSLAPVTSSAPTVDGAALYNQYCSSCHGQSKRNASASSTQSAINSNKGGMGSLRSLTSAQLAAISGSAAGATTSSRRSSEGEDD